MECCSLGISDKFLTLSIRNFCGRRSRHARKSRYRNGRGKGYWTARRATLARAGAKVALADTDVERLQKTLKEVRDIGAEGVAIPTDVRDEINVRNMVHQTAERFGQIDALINDAGIVPHFNWGIRAGRGCVFSAKTSGIA